QLDLLLALIFDAEQVFPFPSARRGQGVCQSPGQELLSARRVKVRQITARMPAAKAFGLILGREFVMPLPLRFDELVDVGLHVVGTLPQRSADAHIRANFGSGDHDRTLSIGRSLRFNARMWASALLDF